MEVPKISSFFSEGRTKKDLSPHQALDADEKSAIVQSVEKKG